VLRDALRWDPDRPMLHRKRGRCRWQLAQDYRTAVHRHEGLVRAVASFRQALDLSEHHTLDVQLVSHYWLARLHKELGEYERAIPYLRRATICKAAEPLIRVLLGEAYIRAYAYDAAEDELEKAAETVAMSERDYGRHFEDTGWPPGRVKAYAYTLLALGYAQRGVESPKADSALEAAREALEAARGKEPDQTVDAAEAAYEFVRGLFALEGHKTAEPDGVTTAVTCFKTSLGLSPQSETYVGLARACLHKIEAGAPSARRWIERGEDACRCANDLDVTGRFSTLADSLLTEFAEVRRWLQERAATQAGAEGERLDEATLAGAKDKAKDARSA
jgi:tetratricopeptide (TPR) repeat protein